MWKIRTRKELTPIFIILNLTRHDKHGCISGPNMSQHVPTIYILHADIFKYIRYSYAFAVEFWFYDLICDDSTVMHVSIYIYMYIITALHGTCVL